MKMNIVASVEGLLCTLINIPVVIFMNLPRAKAIRIKFLGNHYAIASVGSLA